MKTRRDVLETFAGISFIGAVASKAEAAIEIDNCRTQAAALAGSMKSLHGGDWSVNFDVKSEFILIFKRGG